jgi:hypothetical protein
MERDEVMASVSLNLYVTPLKLQRAIMSGGMKLGDGGTNSLYILLTSLQITAACSDNDAVGSIDLNSQNI